MFSRVKRSVVIYQSLKRLNDLYPGPSNFEAVYVMGKDGENCCAFFLFFELSVYLNINAWVIETNFLNPFFQLFTSWVHLTTLSPITMSAKELAKEEKS
jgi:hypothetical protein